MENGVLPKGEFYIEEELTTNYNEGYIYFYDVVRDTKNESPEHAGYSRKFYKELNDCVKDAYEYIKINEDLYENGYGINSRIRFVQILGLTDQKDYEGNRLYLRICDLSYSYLRSYNKSLISFSKDILRGDGYEKLFPHITEVVERKELTDNDLSVIEDGPKLTLKK